MTSADIVATVHLFGTARGGREGPTAPDKYGCLLEIGTSTFDCRLLLSQHGMAQQERKRHGDDTGKGMSG